MKNYEQITNDLLRRRDKYVAEQRKKKKRLVVTAASMCCVCIAVLMGVGLHHGGQTISAPEQTVNDALYPGIKDNFDESKGESPDDVSANNKIVINKIDSTSAARLKLDIDIKEDDFVEMSLDEMKEYYGADFVPVVPDDIKPWKDTEDERYGVYKRDGGTGEVYYETTILNYSSEDYKRDVHLEISKGKIPFSCCLHFDGTEEKSVINNHEVFIGLSEGGYYYTEFMYQGVGFIIHADGVSQEEFVNIIASVIK